ncbi:hypothetical protein AAC387_Pa07g1975 [Persea americana]
MESNFIDWKRTLDIVLTASGCRYVLTIPSLPEPELDAPQFEKDLYTKWTKDNVMARCFIQASMSSDLQHQHRSYKSAYDIISNLKEMFADQVRPARQAVMKVLINRKMVEGTPVQKHLLKMMFALNELDVLGAKIDTESQIDMILQSLPDSFNHFEINYNKLEMTIAELSRQLIVTEEIMKKEQNPLMTEKSFARTKPKGKDRDSKKKLVIKGPKVENGSNYGMAKAKGMRVKGKCFHCGMTGHWKRNCPDLLSKKRTSGMIESLVSEVSFATGTSESWCVDSGATNHICNTL